MKMNKEFRFYSVGIEGKQKIIRLIDDFDKLMDSLNDICPESRELSICKTKLEEAYFFAKKSICFANKRVARIKRINISGTKF